MRPLILASLLVFLAFSGCMGGSDEAQPNVATDDSAVSPTDGTNPTSPTDSTGAPVNECDQKYHAHDNWGTRTELYLFNNYEVDLGNDPVHEMNYRDGILILGYQALDTRMDGADVGSSDKSDVVLQGTKELRFTISWASDANIPGLTFYFKPANSPRFTEVEDIQNGEEYVIGIGKGMSDMAHQLSLSRWKFALEAYDPAVAGAPAKAYAAVGQAKITMKAIKGDASHLDDPHPYFFVDSSTRLGGELNRTLDTVTVNSDPAPAFEYGSSMFGWKMDAPYIVPWDTLEVWAWLHYNYTGSASAVAHDLGLRFTDSSGTDQKSPEATDSGDNWAFYKIPIEPIQADGPYAKSTDWVWGVYPILNGDVDDRGGDFKGDIHLRLVVYGKSDPCKMG